MQLRVLFRDESIIVVDKPAGLEVHPRESGEGNARRTCLSILTKQILQKPYPAHRLDRATAGVLIFSLDSETAANVQRQFQEYRVKKTYYCIARGWIEENTCIDSPLKDEAGEALAAKTHIEVIAKAELPIPCGRYETIRMSLLRVNPETGRFHQIRRHLASISHPIIGDPRHGDKKLNRIFTEHSQIKRLLLQAHALTIQHPKTNEPIRFQSRWTKDWHGVFDIFQICPLEFSHSAVQGQS